MGWGKTGQPGIRRRLTWSNDEWNRAAALCAGQLPLVWLAWWFAMEAGRDDYDQGGGAYLGIFCVLLVLPLLGLLHATVQIMPAATLAQLRPRTARGPEWSWHLAGSALIGTVWAALGHAVWGWPVTDTLPWFAGVGALPVLALALLRGRPWGSWGVWLRSAGASFVLLVVCGVTAGSLAGHYEPPELAAGQLLGNWHGADGGVLLLAPDGRAELTHVPAHNDADEDGDFTLCDGTGRWTREEESDVRDTDRDGVLVRLDSACGQETYWTIGGTERNPELFVRFGDPDDGELRILTRR
ncbi:putative integral membrane protein [Streptomyces ambofaciens ATCC 23877]|uniref:Putative integral membrane protein n=1 Tax=Streptomyces ambofaciens (strain ATCC 23877 / 3486 / DSM 40053 / JCM 4204 / NBRC 12836 / NRRL B-2516) TaxID=278992 RepID=A0ABZ9_STRA7|nr:hypothetical protein [Streptomyces ambofaciens]AKZ60362.1 putative integral membrane protein [Streptomyces ambofaciens ATCC 23877]CAJ88002.1 putative integral membrane protein [Streptomyces ambofaciens ATCC 23877]